jgi:hypothetical protein
MDVSVNGEDLAGLNIAMQPTGHVTGHLVFDGTTAAPDPTKVHVGIINGAQAAMRAMVAAGMMAPASLGVSPYTANADGTFDLDGLIPGSFSISVTPAPPGLPGWWLRSVMIGERDVLDTPLGFSGGALPPAIVTFTDRHTALAGAIQGAPTASYAVMIIPKDPSQRRVGARRVQFARVSADGRYGFKDLPPGAYLVTLLIDFEPEDMLDPAFFDRLVSAAVTVTIGEGEQKTQDFKVGGVTILGMHR